MRRAGGCAECCWIELEEITAAGAGGSIKQIDGATAKRKKKNPGEKNVWRELNRPTPHANRRLIGSRSSTPTYEQHIETTGILTNKESPCFFFFYGRIMDFLTGHRLEIIECSTFPSLQKTAQQWLVGRLSSEREEQ